MGQGLGLFVALVEVSGLINSQHLHGGSQPVETAVTGDSMPSYSFRGTRHARGAQIYT